MNTNINVTVTGTFNRTILELKQLRLSCLQKQTSPFNRTILELKQ